MALPIIYKHQHSAEVYHDSEELIESLAGDYEAKEIEILGSYRGDD